MFVGHYGVSFAAQPVHKPLPLWLLFVAVQWLDVRWSVLVMLGIEKLRVVPGFTQASALYLYHMPYTHGLVRALALFRAARRGGRGVLPVALAHLPGRCRLRLLPLAAGSPGPCAGHAPDRRQDESGLRRNGAISFPLEMVCLWAGAAIHAVAVPVKRGNVWLWPFVAALSVLQAVLTFGPQSGDPLGTARSALAAHLILALPAGLVGRRRIAA